MKFNFRKIASVLASVVMVGSTIGLAAAANYPAPFVQSGAANVAIVYGSGDLFSDQTAAGVLKTSLGTELVKQGGGGNTGPATCTGDCVSIEKSTNKFNLGDGISDIYASLDSGDFENILKDGTYFNDLNNEYKYEQTLALGELNLTQFQDNDFNDNKPIIGFNLNSGEYILNYTLKFTPTAVVGGTDFANLENTEIEMLGKSFFISEAVATATNGLKLTMLDTANTAIVAEGETKSVTVGTNAPYDVTIESLSGTAAAPEVQLTVSGITTRSLSEGQTFNLGNGLYVGIKDINFRDVAGTTGKVEFSLGMGKLVLENGQEVELNDDPISDIEDSHGYSSVINAYITNSTTDVSKLVLEWKLNDDAWIAPGTDLVMPGFNAIKYSMAGFTTPKSEITTIKDDGDAVKVLTQVEDGEVGLHILSANDSISGFNVIGEKSTHKLVTGNGSVATTALTTRINLNETENSYFVATWISGDDSESYVYEIGTITDSDGKNATTLENRASGGTDISLSEIGDTDDNGQITFSLIAANDDLKTASIGIKAASSGKVYADRLITKEGLQMKLPVQNITTMSDGKIDLTAAANPASWNMNFTEEDKDGNIEAGKSFTVPIGLDVGDGTEPKAITVGITPLETDDNSDIFVGYVVSDIATKVLFDDPSNDLSSLDITYPGEESYASVFISSPSAGISADGTDIGNVLVSDAQVASVANLNLIVVGGSCINAEAQKILGVTAPLCTTEFTAKTGITVGQALIQVAASPENSGKIAMLIAGYEADDTTKAVKWVTTTNPSTDKGKIVKLSTGTSVTSIAESS